MIGAGLKMNCRERPSPGKAHTGKARTGKACTGKARTSKARMSKAHTVKVCTGRACTSIVHGKSPREQSLHEQCASHERRKGRAAQPGLSFIS